MIRHQRRNLGARDSDSSPAQETEEAAPRTSRRPASVVGPSKIHCGSPGRRDPKNRLAERLIPDSSDTRDSGFCTSIPCHPRTTEQGRGNRPARRSGKPSSAFIIVASQRRKKTDWPVAARREPDLSMRIRAPGARTRLALVSNEGSAERKEIRAGLAQVKPQTGLLRELRQGELARSMGWRDSMRDLVGGQELTRVGRERMRAIGRLGNAWRASCPSAIWTNVTQDSLERQCEGTRG